MGRAIPDENGGGEFNPTAELRAYVLDEKGNETKEGVMLKGIVAGKREVKTTYGPKPVYSFTVLDATCKFTKDKQEIEPKEGALVDAFAPTRLARQLAHVTDGQTVTIVYAGKKKVGRGQPAHIFNVEVE